MQYIDEKGNKLIIKKDYENQSDGSYWIVISFKSMPKKNVTIHSKNMSMQIFVRGGEIVNRNMTIKETPYIISASTHNYERREAYDESFVKIDYKDLYTTSSKKDSMVLDPVKLTDEEQEIILEQLFKDNNIKISMTPFLNLFQKSLSELKALTEEYEDMKSELIFNDYENEVENLLKPIRVSTMRQEWLKKEYERKNNKYNQYIKK